MIWQVRARLPPDRTRKHWGSAQEWGTIYELTQKPSIRAEIEETPNLWMAGRPETER